jgi:glucokinase
MSICGNVDESSGVATLTPNLGWHDIPIRDLLEAGLGARVRIGTDTLLAALAELVWGAGRNAGNFIWVTLGTGYGAALVLDGHVFGGDHGYAGNLGHAQLGSGSELVCGCGQRGCVETVVAAPAIARAGQAAVSANRSTRLAELAATGAMSAALVLEAASGNDPAARGIVDQVLEALTISLAAAINLLDLSLVVLGGGVLSAAPWMIDELDAQLRPRLMTREMRQDLRLIPESFPDSALWGAAALAFGFDK